MTQDELWHDTVEDALRAVVVALGGPKRVGADLWPAKPVQEAARYLNQCLDSERPEKLSLGEVVWLLRKGSEAGCHTAMAYLAEACLYEPPRRVNREARRDELRREFIGALDRLDMLRRDLERLEG